MEDRNGTPPHDQWPPPANLLGMARAKYKTSSKYLIEPYRAAPGRPSAAEKRSRPKYPQAQSIINKFGGPRELARTLKAASDDPNDHYSPSTIYRWLYPAPRGTDGKIPIQALNVIMKVARLAGVILSSKDIYPHLNIE